MSSSYKQRHAKRFISVKWIMVAGCGIRVLKFCLFAFNLIFFIAGAAALGVGIWLVLDQNITSTFSLITNSTILVDTAERQPELMKDAAIVLAAGGGIMFVIAFFGCCGAAKEWRPMLIAYISCLVIILGIEVAAAIYAGINKDTIGSKIQIGMSSTLHKYYNDSNAYKRAWDDIMKMYHCCGVWSNQTDFNGTEWQQHYPNLDYPDTCCYNPPCSDVNKYTQGCYEAIKNNFQTNFITIIGIGSGIAAMQLIGIIFAMCVCKAIRSEEIV